MVRQISQRSVGGRRNPVGIGYVAIPKDIDRDLYVENCFRNGYIAIQTDWGEFFDKVKIDKVAIQNITFPLDSNNLGSLVVWVNYPKHNQPIIVGVISKNDEFLNIVEHQFLLSKESGGTIVEISGDADQGIIFVNINEKSSGGIFTLNVRNQEGSAKINLHVDGDFNIEAGKKITLFLKDEIDLIVKDPINDPDKETIISYKRGVGFSYKDEFNRRITIDETGVTIDAGNADIIVHNDNSSVSITDSGVDIDSNKSITIGGQFNVLYSLVPEAPAILDVSEIGVSKKVRVG